MDRDIFIGSITGAFYMFVGEKMIIVISYIFNCISTYFHVYVPVQFFPPSSWFALVLQLVCCHTIADRLYYE